MGFGSETFRQVSAVLNMDAPANLDDDFNVMVSAEAENSDMIKSVGECEQ